MKKRYLYEWDYKITFFSLLLICLSWTGVGYGQNLNANLYSSMKYRFIGPGGNRVSAVMGEPGNRDVYYAGAASGGLWKSTDGGIHWDPIFDDQGVQSIGAIAIDKSEPHTLWVGTGESFIRSNVSIGDGIYKSTDGGRTWQHMGLTKTGRIGRIEINPNNTDVVYACAQGTNYGPQPERGVFRTKDGGKTWEKILSVDEHTGCSGLDMDKSNPNILFAGMWDYYLKTWGQFSGGPGSGVFVSRDGGDNWQRLTPEDGLPESPLGKIDVTVAPNNSDRVYALIETGDRGSLWRSDDGGHNWHNVHHSRLINERPHYYTRMLVSPNDYNSIWFPSNRMYESNDGGETIEQVSWGGDTHDMWADPTNANRMMIGDDGGILITHNKGRSWDRIILPIGQMYHVAVDRSTPYNVYSNMQDDGSVMGPNRNVGGYGISSATWHSTGGCESGFSYPDTVSGRWVYAGCYSGEVEIYDRKTKYKRAIAPWPDKSLDSPAKVLKYRWNWTQPIAISPNDHNKVYVGSQYVHMTEDRGQSWEVISPDLTLNDTTRMGSSGGLTPDNLGVEYWGTLFAIAESPVKPGVIWAGSNDGLVHVTKDGGENWENVTENIPDFPEYGTISNINPSPFEAGKAYISVDYHQVDNRKPYIYKTSDYGQHWEKITEGIPSSPLSYVHIVRADPFKPGLLYAGTENALYVSIDDGEHWLPFQNNLPPAPVTWITVQPDRHDLAISTKGRGLYILDDLTPLEQLDQDILSSDAHLFKPRSAYRFRAIHQFRGFADDLSRGENPPYGAPINYYLKSSTDAPVKIEILDQSGKLVRQLRGSGEKGINRTWWDLRYPDTKTVELRTTPESHPHVWEEKRFRGEDTREIYHWGISGPKRGPLAMPGTYQVRLTVDGKTFTKPLKVNKDPNTPGTMADVRAQSDLWLKIYSDINKVVTMINRIERVRKQIEDLPVYLAGRSDSTAVMKQANELDKKALAVEDQLFQRFLAAGDTKTYPDELKLYLKLVWLAGEVGSGAGDVAGSPDYPPTDQSLEVYKLMSKRLEKAESDYKQFMSTSVANFNNKVGSENIKGITLPPSLDE